MKHIVYDQSDHYPVCLMVKSTAFDAHAIKNAYTDPLVTRGVNIGDLVVVEAKYNEHDKAPGTLVKSWLAEMLPQLDSVGVQTIYCADATYFKALTKEKKAEPFLGYVKKCRIPDYEHIDIIFGMNYRSLIYNPANEPKLEMSLNTLASHISNTYEELGANILHSGSFPKTEEDILEHLNKLHEHSVISCDIEAFSLRFEEAGIGTIGFAWSSHDGFSFPVDYEVIPKTDHGHYGQKRNNNAIKHALRAFFESYRGTVRWHNSPYDIKILIYELWMADLLDMEGMLRGLEVMTRLFDDTKIIMYLATNTTAGNHLSLKDGAHEFAGNWAHEDIKDIRRIPLDELLRYNLVDCLSTNYVYDKYYPEMCDANQLELYRNLFMPSQKTIIEMELCGMPMDPEAIIECEIELGKIKMEQVDKIMGSPIIKPFNKELQKDAMVAHNAKLKKLQHPIEKFADVTFNPNSGPQKQKLLYDYLNLPIIDLTKSKQPATKSKTIEKLLNHVKTDEERELLEALREYSYVEKILTSFIPAFKRAIDKGDGVVYLHGSFNLGGTVSGRLSSSDPNMQNIPSGSRYAKLIKKCFKAPKGWIFCGADFNSLEDYISALTTKDPNKLKVYLDGYDGHCLRAFSYFPDELPGITDDVDSINSIKEKFPAIRQKSKNPTFALTYQGTYHTLMKNLGFSEDKAKQIEKNYHELYKVSDQWVESKLDEASRTGYVEVAFGLRVRTPLLGKTIKAKRPYEAQAEGRTAGNALGQSYGLLNNRAVNEFMERVWNHPEYRYLIKPIALIHDAIYLLIADKLEIVDWVNRNLIECMEWQELPEIKHDKVKLGAALDIFYPTWADDLTLPNKASRREINELCIKHATRRMQC